MGFGGSFAQALPTRLLMGHNLPLLCSLCFLSLWRKQASLQEGNAGLVPWAPGAPGLALAPAPRLTAYYAKTKRKANGRASTTCTPDFLKYFPKYQADSVSLPASCAGFAVAMPRAASHHAAHLQPRGSPGGNGLGHVSAVHVSPLPQRSPGCPPHQEA